MSFNSSNSDQLLHPFLEAIADRIRLHRSLLPDLKQLEIESDLINIKGKLGNDDLFIANELHISKGFRKLHLERAKIGSGLHVLHCVFFPSPAFDIPIFGVDVVATPVGISAAIVDLSPVDKDLPLRISSQIEDIIVPSFSQKRELPVWGDIFSKYVYFIRPEGCDEEASFIDIVDQYLRILVESIAFIEPDPPNSCVTIGRYDYQKLYCIQQKRNDKTRNVLSKAFNPNWANRYIETLLFDCP